MEEYKCNNCGRIFKRYKSQVVSKEKVCCSKKCANKFAVRSGRLKGKNNPRYKHGEYCENSYCSCGNLKDSRAIKCAKCANVSYSKVDSVGREYNEKLILETVPFVKSFVELSRVTEYPRHIVTKIIRNNNIDISHFRNKFTKDVVLKSVFIKNSTTTRATLKTAILKFNLLEYKCNKCGIIDSYNTLPIIIQLHHKDGNKHNNLLENLEFLCPNCHSQTNTFCGANKKYNFKLINNEDKI